MPEGFDFDEYESDLQIGLEVEYPAKDPEDELFIDRGRPTNSLQSEMSELPPHIGGRPVYDGTVGLEIVSNVLNIDEAPNWYRDVLDYVREDWNTEYQPTGLMSTGNTAGLHMHLSELSRREAEDLFEISQTPWAKVLFCSSIAMSEDSAVWPVFRGGQYCRMNLGTNHYDCINDRGAGRYEWRLPEPMTPEHLDIVVRFLKLFDYSTEKAIEYAQEVLDEGDDRITAIKRAEAVGMDIEEVPTVERERYAGDDSFFDMVRNTWAAPEIYHVEYLGEHYYVFDSEIDATIEAGPIEFHPEDVVRASSLEAVENDELADEVRTAFRRRNEGSPRETEATEELKKIVKKKKGH